MERHRARGHPHEQRLPVQNSDAEGQARVESSDLRERIRRDIERKFFILPWGKCYRRDFLLEKKIFFPQMKYAEDVTFCFKCLCLAKTYVRIPHMTNIHRVIEGFMAQTGDPTGTGMGGSGKKLRRIKCFMRFYSIPG